MLGGVETRSVSPVFVGRADELAVLTDALTRAAGREPQAMLIGGEAGVGKTRLTEEFLCEADRRGAVVAVGGCVEIGAEGLPFAPFSTALRTLHRLLARRVGRRGRRPGGRTRPDPPRTRRHPARPARRGEHRPALRTDGPDAGAARRRPHRRPRPGGPALGGHLHPAPALLPLPHPRQRPARRRRHLPRGRRPPPPPAAPPPRRTGPAPHRPAHRAAPLQPGRGAPPARRDPRRAARRGLRRLRLRPLRRQRLLRRGTRSPPGRAAAAPDSPNPCATCSSSASRSSRRTPSGWCASSPRAAPPWSTRCCAPSPGSPRTS